MEFHPHIHSIVTDGGLKNNKWINTKNNYLFKVEVLSSLFKNKFLNMLKESELVLHSHLSYLKEKKD